MNFSPTYFQISNALTAISDDIDVHGTNLHHMRIDMCVVTMTICVCMITLIITNDEIIMCNKKWNDLVNLCLVGCILQIEIKCKGQRLLPLLTLQYVRDNIWSSSRDFITLLPNSSTTHHIMVLHYARTHPSN